MLTGIKLNLIMTATPNPKIKIHTAIARTTNPLLFIDHPSSCTINMPIKIRQVLTANQKRLILKLCSTVANNAKNKAVSKLLDSSAIPKLNLLSK